MKNGWSHVMGGPNDANGLTITIQFEDDLQRQVSALLLLLTSVAEDDRELEEAGRSDD